MGLPMASSKMNRTITTLIICLVLAAVPHPLRSNEYGQDPEQSFSTFAAEWIDQIRTAYLYSRKAPKIEETATGFVASYHYLDTASVQWEIKPAEGQDGVFTSVLYYEEHLAQSRAATEANARKGPFAIVATKEMMEIFLYENGAWMR
jgi:hypothetical protein